VIAPGHEVELLKLSLQDEDGFVQFRDRLGGKFLLIDGLAEHSFRQGKYKAVPSGYPRP
jgi:hypothetical protein